MRIGKGAKGLTDESPTAEMIHRNPPRTKSRPVPTDGTWGGGLGPLVRRRAGVRSGRILAWPEANRNIARRRIPSDTLWKPNQRMMRIATARSVQVARVDKRTQATLARS